MVLTLLRMGEGQKGSLPVFPLFFIIVGCVWQILGRAPPLTREQPRKSPSWIGLRKKLKNGNLLSVHVEFVRLLYQI